MLSISRYIMYLEQTKTKEKVVKIDIVKIMVMVKYSLIQPDGRVSNYLSGRWVGYIQALCS